VSHSQEPVREHDTPANGHDVGGWYPGALIEPVTVRRPWRRTAVAGILTLLAIVAAGVPLGLLWSWISPSVPVVETTSSGAVVSEPSPEQFIAADGWFTIVGFAFGVLAALAAWFLARRHRGPVLLSGVVLGAFGAAVVAWQVGRRLGLSGWVRWQDTAVAGDTFNRPPDLNAYGPLLVPAFAAVIVCTLLAGWSNDPDLDVPGAKPGHGRDLPGGHTLAPYRPASVDHPGYENTRYDQTGHDQTGFEPPNDGRPGHDQSGHELGKYDQR
jgi:hypothetical protein